MKSKEEILKILQEELPNLREGFNVKTIGLFGSYAREEQTEKSDIDLLVEFEKPIDFFKLVELEDHLSELLGAKVEVVTPDALKERIKPYIMRDIAYV